LGWAEKDNFLITALTGIDLHKIISFSHDTPVGIYTNICAYSKLVKSCKSADAVYIAFCHCHYSTDKHVFKEKK
jgi:hypothetical protein